MQWSARFVQLSVLGVGLLAAGCSFDSALGGAECTVEGERSDDGTMRCENGYWVAVDAGTGIDDTGVPVDTPSDTTPPTDSSSETGLDTGTDILPDLGCDAPETWYRDEDGDGFGASGLSRVACDPPDGYVADGGDCNDAAPMIHPGASERCNGSDDNCDGAVDEGQGCECTYDPNELNKVDTDSDYKEGVCTGQTIDDGGVCAEPGDFAPRTDDEKAEGVCDGKDNDCDGTTDEGCGCTYDPTEPQNTDTDKSHNSGVCTAQPTTGGDCDRPADFESRTDTESQCDGIDNDCDGAIDEGCTCTYDPNEADKVDTDGSHDHGLCPGQMRNGNGVCTEPTDFEIRTDTESQCNGDDNDCDGAIDEGCSCIYDPTETDNIDTDGSHDTGVCTNQSQDPNGVCQKPSEYESPEATKCGDGLDNDCDGTTDETNRPQAVGDSCSNDCECATGMCQSGTCVHVMFVTSTLHDGNLGGASGADSECSAVASGAGVPGSWGALISGTTSANSRTTVTAPVYNLAGSKIADGKSDLWSGSIANAVSVNENGAAANRRVWTGTSSDGTSGNTNCSNWSNNTGGVDGVEGLSDATGGAWLDNGPSRCKVQKALYCINGQ